MNNNTSIKLRSRSVQNIGYSEGVGLIEIMITVFVLSVGLLGIAAVQALGVRYNYDSYVRSQAMSSANELAERMRTNIVGVNAGDYANAVVGCPNSQSPNIPAAPAPAQICEAGTLCTPAQLAIYDVYRTACGYGAVNTEAGGVHDLLPQGSIQILCTAPCAAGSTHTITVSWLQKQDNNAALAAKQVQILFQP